MSSPQNIAYVERSDIDYRIKTPRTSRISLAAPADRALLRQIMPDAQSPEAKAAEPVQPAKTPRQLISKEWAREVIMDWLRKQTELKSTYDMAEDEALIEAMGKKCSSGTLWAHLRQMSEQGLVTCQKRTSPRNGSWATVAYWRATK